MIEFKNCEECPNIEVAKPFVIKTIELFESEFLMNVQHSELVSLEEPTEVNNINFISNLTGSIEANLIFSFEHQLAKKLLESFPYIEYEEDMEDEMMVETVAEFLNIVIGNAMRDIPSSAALHFSPPLGVTGESKIYCGKEAQVCKIKLVLDDGEMLIIFSTLKKDN